jgi:hypothetical protein
MHLLNSRLLHRRTLLKSAGVALGLPLLEAMLPGGARSWAAAPQSPLRMLLIGRPLGMHTPLLFPEQAGRDYELTPYLQVLAEHRRDMTVISGMAHVGYGNGHSSDIALFTGAPWENIKNPRDIRNTVSLDQVAVEAVRETTRFPNLVLGSDRMSHSRNGTPLPSDGNPSTVFKRLFIEATPEENRRIVRDLQDGRSVLDQVREQAKALERSLGPADRVRLEQYFTSVREAEARLQQDGAWALKPKPKVDAEMQKPVTDERYLLDRTRNFYNLVQLALQTDSTRVVALWIHSHASVFIDGKPTLGHHDLSHHGQDDHKIEQLSLIEREELREFAGLLTKMKATNEEGGTLLDHTLVFHGSNLSNANSHSPKNLPILVAGGGLKHGQHLAYDQANNRPLGDLYLTMLQRFGVETDSFGGSRDTISELQ